jgi:Tetrapyrrole (Corrin/Porphyrin) Methylases
VDDALEEKWRKALAAVPLGTAPAFNLACIGTSIRSLGAFTFDGLACLACADVVYYYPPTRIHFESMRLINRNVVNVHETLYVRGGAFDPVYDAIVDHVMCTVRSGKKVAYAVQGSPAFHCGTAIRLHRNAKREGFSSILISGVSSFELLSAELSEHYDITNIQIYSVVQVAEGALPINTTVPCLLFDLGRYALPAVREAVSTYVRPNLTTLAGRLRAAYPLDHEVLLLSVNNRTGCCSSLKTSPADLEDALMSSTVAVTIFLPAIRTLS